MNVFVQYLIVMMMCVSPCFTRNIQVAAILDNLLENELLESYSAHNDMDPDFYKETEIDIDFPEDSRQLKVIIEDKRDDIDARFESLSSGISSSLKSSSQSIANMGESAKEHMEYLLMHIIIMLQEEMTKDTREARTHRHHKHRHPRSRPKRSIRAILKDTNVQKILMEFFRQKQGEDNGNPLLRFG